MIHETRQTEPDSFRLQGLATLQTEHKILIEFLEKVYDDSRSSSMRWDLVLGNPSLSQALSRLSGASKTLLAFEFLEKVAESTRFVKVIYPKDIHVQRSSPHSASHRPRPLQLQGFTSLDLSILTAYTLAALSAVRSSILLYNSRWIDGLCFCGINLYEASDSKEAAVYFADTNCSHIDSKLRGQAFLLLAVLLAELAMGAPIIAYPPSGSPTAGPRFEVPEMLLLPGYYNRMTWDRLSELLSERIYQVPEQYISFEYLEAMDYCFELSQTLAKRDFCADDLETCVKRIVTP